MCNKYSYLHSAYNNQNVIPISYGNTLFTQAPVSEYRSDVKQNIVLNESYPVLQVISRSRGPFMFQINCHKKF